MVETGGLENRCTGNRTGGSNPSPSAIDIIRRHKLAFTSIRRAPLFRRCACWLERAHNKICIVNRRSALVSIRDLVPGVTRLTIALRSPAYTCSDRRLRGLRLRLDADRVGWAARIYSRQGDTLAASCGILIRPHPQSCPLRVSQR